MTSLAHVNCYTLEICSIWNMWLLSNDMQLSKFSKQIQVGMSEPNHQFDEITTLISLKLLLPSRNLQFSFIDGLVNMDLN